MVLAEPLPAPIHAILLTVQNDLFDLGGEVSIPGRSALWDAHLKEIEKQIKTLREPLAPLKEFILPGGARAAAACHVARAVCRRAERSLVALGRSQGISALSIQYLNRLSDLLFLAARSINVAAGVPEPLWKPGREGKP